MIKLIRQNTKIYRLLKLFSSGKRLHRFQAERYGDHTLNSSISDIQRRYGLSFQQQFMQHLRRLNRSLRKSIKVNNSFGGETSIMLYFFDKKDREAVQMLLEKPMKKPAIDANQERALSNQCKSTSQGYGYDQHM